MSVSKLMCTSKVNRRQGAQSVEEEEDRMEDTVGDGKDEVLVVRQERGIGELRSRCKWSVGL